MIPVELQEELEKRVTKCLENYQIPDPHHQQAVEEDKNTAIKIYKQHLPKKDKADESLYPYVLIKLMEGEQDTDNTATVLLLAAAYDDEDSYQGFQHTAGILQKIYQDIMRNQVVGKRFSLQLPIRWAFPDDDTFPYFFGAIETMWELPSALREDVEGMI